MATRLIDMAEMAEGLYYQDYATRDAFFDKRDFMDHCAQYYSKALNELFQAKRVESKKEIGFTDIEISPSWLIFEDAEMKCESSRCIVTTQHDIFSFDFDNYVYALDSVFAPEVELRRINRTEANFLSLMPTIDRVLYWVREKNKVEFTKHVKGKLTLGYIPVVVGNDHNSVLSDNIAADVIKAVLNLMFGAKQGNVVDETNDGNLNNVLPQQVNNKLNKVQSS